MDVGGAAPFGMSGVGIYKRIHPLLEGISFLSFAVESSDVMDHN